MREKKTWLLTWNVDRWAWDDELFGYKELISEIEQVGHAYYKWTCGVNKSIQKGDRVFMIKLGSYPKGIVASGYAMTTVFEGVHWERTKKIQGRRARRIYIDFDKIYDYEADNILDYEVLKNISTDYHWSTQSSGIEIPKDIAREIELRWKAIDLDS